VDSEPTRAPAGSREARIPRLWGNAVLGPMLLLALALGSARADGWEAYRPASLREAWAQALAIPDTAYTVETLEVKFRVDARYTDRHRKIDPSSQALLARWCSALQHPLEWEYAFDHEVELEDQGQTAWLLLQDPLVGPFAAEVQRGARLRVYVLYIGAVGERRVFAINRFQVLPPER
jgi:hypothetical protein